MIENVQEKFKCNIIHIDSVALSKKYHRTDTTSETCRSTVGNYYPVPHFVCPKILWKSSNQYITWLFYSKKNLESIWIEKKLRWSRQNRKKRKIEICSGFFSKIFVDFENRIILHNRHFFLVSEIFLISIYVY